MLEVYNFKRSQSTSVRTKNWFRPVILITKAAGNFIKQIKKFIKKISVDFMPKF